MPLQNCPFFRRSLYATEGKTRCHVLSAIMRRDSLRRHVPNPVVARRSVGRPQRQWRNEARCTLRRTTPSVPLPGQQRFDFPRFMQVAKAQKDVASISNSNLTSQM